MSTERLSETERATSPEPQTCERRGNPRRPFVAVFSMRFSEDAVLGAGRDLSESGAYFVTSDDLKTEVTFEIDGKEVQVPASITRIEKVSNGTLGIAVRFERRVEVPG